MSPKSIIFVFAIVLAVARMGSSLEPVQAPAYAPYTHPTPPTSPLPWGFGTACTAMCFSYCRPYSPRRACMRTCTACCAKYRCVPEFSKCCEWGEVTIHNTIFKCPANKIY